MTSRVPATHSRRTSSNRLRARQVVAWGMAVFGIALGVVLNQAGLRLEGGSVAILGLAPVILDLDRHLFQGLLLGPLAFMYLYHALGYAIGPLWQLYVFGWSDIIEDGFVAAQWGGVLGLVTFAVTFWKFFRAIPERMATTEGPQGRGTFDAHWHGYGGLILLTAAILIGYGFTTGAVNRLGGQETSIETASIALGVQHIHQVMFFFLAYSAARRRGLWMILWLVSLTGYAVFFFLDGGRGTVAMAVILSGIGLVWGGVSPRKVVLVGAIALTVYLPITGVVLTYRNYYADRPETFSKRIAGFLDAGAYFFEERSSLADLGETFFRNITAQSVDRVFLLTPEVIPFAGLESLDQVVFTVVPRIIWPDRPDPLNGNDLAILFGAALPGTTGSYMPAVGDGYRRGGWIGVVLLYMFSAAIYGSIVAVCWARRDHREWMAMLVLVMVLGTGLWSATLLSNFNLALWVFPKYLVLFWLLRRLQDRLIQVLPHGRRTRPSDEWLIPQLPPVARRRYGL